MTSTSSAHAAGAQTLYASVGGVAYALGEDECVFQARGSRDTHVMTPQVLAALDATRAFRTLAEHAQAIGERNRALAEKPDAVMRVLNHLVQRGLLVRDADYLARLGSAAVPPPARFAGVFIRACERPAQLRRLLASLAASSAAGAAVRVVVVDDSRVAANQKSNAAVLTEFSIATGLATEHVGGERWTRLSDHLARARPEASAALAYALAGRTRLGAAGAGGGKGYNLIALLAAGRRYAMLDDDFVFPLAVPEQVDSGLALDPQGEFPTRFFATDDDAVASGNALAKDPLALHLGWCGQRLSDLPGADGGPRLVPAALAGFEPSRHPELGPETRILATLNGHRGSSGAADSRWLFMLEGESRALLCADRERYLGYLDSASVWHGPDRPSLLPYAHFTPFVVDGAQLLPPTLPSGRCEDLLFGVLGHALHPQGVVLHAATTIGHLQERRASRRKSLFGAQTPGFAQYLADWVNTELAGIRAEEPAARMSALAASLEDLAAAPLPHRIELLHEYLRYRRADFVDRLQRAFAGFAAAPIYWQADVRELITVNGRALTESAPPRLAGWPADLDEAGCAARLSDELREFATLLRHWPALWATAAERGDSLLAG